MGKSYIIHCVGVPHGSAMSRLELMQEEWKEHKAGRIIQYWFAQTKVGQKILGCAGPITLEELGKRGITNYKKLVTCPVCQGDGYNSKYFCPVCNGSGLCKPGNEKHWQPWQIEYMREIRKEGNKKEGNKKEGNKKEGNKKERYEAIN